MGQGRALFYDPYGIQPRTAMLHGSMAAELLVTPWINRFLQQNQH